MTTLSDNITEVEILLSQTAGVSVQKYTEPRIAKYVQRAFDILFKRAWWGQFRHWQLITLDGSTGFPTAASDYKDIGDIMAIYPSDQQKRLTKLPFPMNPFLITGTQAMYVEPQAGVKLFRVWPIASIGQLYVQGRQKPANFSLDDDIAFDDLALQTLAAWEYCVDDGNNPAQAERLQVMFDQRLIALLGEEVGNIPTDLDPRFANVPNQWIEWP